MISYSAQSNNFEPFPKVLFKVFKNVFRIKITNGRNGARNLASKIALGKIYIHHKTTLTVNRVSTQEVAMGVTFGVRIHSRSRIRIQTLTWILDQTRIHLDPILILLVETI